MMRMHAIGGVLAILASVAVAQDQVRLKTGATIDGVIVGESDTTVTLQVPGGTFELKRSQIAEITRSDDPDAAAKSRALLTLSRFEDHESFHFLYRDGHRVGYRTIALRREAREGVPGYALHDRLVFVPQPGAAPGLDLQVTEFADAELRPQAFQVRSSSGLSSRVVEGRREGELLEIEEQSGGRRFEHRTYFREDAEFPGILLLRIATQPVPEGGYLPYRIFRPETLSFSEMRLERSLERVSLRGRLKDVLVFRHTTGDRVIESWVDLAGHLVRQEIGSPRLVSMVAPRDDVLAFARGEDVSSERELGLEIISEEAGLRLLRPDHGWEAVPGDPARRTIVSLLHPGRRATVDVFRLVDLPEGFTEEGVALEVLARLRSGGEQAKIEGPFPDRINGYPMLRFGLRCQRRGTDLMTMGTILLHGEQALVILAAAPAETYADALPAFVELHESLRLLEPESTNAADAFDLAERLLGR